MYACGPTVYDYPHIGNYRAYLFEDLLRRYLEYRGYEVKMVMNITDVDDKTIAASGGKKAELKKLTTKYENDFMEGLKTLNVKPADEYPRAFETVDEMVVLIERLIEKGAAYQTDDGSVYFSIEKYAEYGKLVHLKPEEMKAGERVSDDDYEKEGARDFALWKSWKEEDGEIYWETPLGKGRPGWHIECSAMSMKYLGEQLDLHCGGVDNIFPHHENEIAQSEAATGKQFVKYWVHCEHLILEGEKMSKSLGNIKLLKDLIGDGYSPEAIRLALLSTHYRSKLDLTEAKLKEAEGNARRIKDFRFAMGRVIKQEKPEPLRDAVNLIGEKLIEVSKGGDEIDSILKDGQGRFEEGLDDDLNISKAMAAIFDMMNDIYKLRDSGVLRKDGARKAMDKYNKFREVIGIPVPGLSFRSSKENIEFVERGQYLRKEKKGDEIDEIRKQHPRVIFRLSPEVEELVIKRENLREAEKWDEADEIRKQLLREGIILEDTPDGTIVKFPM